MKKIRIYLAGQMEYAKDYGVNWRNTVEKKLINLGYVVFNPANKQKLKSELNLFDKINNDKFNFLLTRDWAVKIIEDDIKALLSCDIILCNWLNNVQSAGTPSELTIAMLHKIPVLLITENIKTVPKWIIGTITDYQKDFKNLEKKLKQIYNIT